MSHWVRYLPWKKHWTNFSPNSVPEVEDSGPFPIETTVKNAVCLSATLSYANIQPSPLILVSGLINFWQILLGKCPLLMKFLWLYLGVETVSPMQEGRRHRRRRFSRSIVSLLRIRCDVSTKMKFAQQQQYPWFMCQKTPLEVGERCGLRCMGLYRLDYGRGISRLWGQFAFGTLCASTKVGFLLSRSTDAAGLSLTIGSLSSFNFWTVWTYRT